MVGSLGHTGWLFGLLVRSHRLVGWFVCWVTQVGWLVGSLGHTGWFDGWLVGQLVNTDWLDGWLVLTGWLVYQTITKNNQTNIILIYFQVCE